jgi:hypothetical protein
VLVLDWKPPHLCARRMSQRLHRDPRAVSAVRLAQAAFEAGGRLGERLCFEDLDRIPEELGATQGLSARPDRFLTSCVWVQALMIGEALQQWDLPPKARARRALTLAVTHSGDSDTLGAIVGNLIGAQLGTAGLPEQMVCRLQNLPALKHLVMDLGRLTPH